MTKLEKYCTDILKYGENNPTKVVVNKGYIITVHTLVGQRRQFMDTSMLGDGEDFIMDSNDAITFTKEKTDLEKWCIERRINNFEPEVHAYDGLYTSQEVETFIKEGFIKIDIECWSNGDTLRRKTSMEKVIFNKYSKGGWFYAMGKKHPLKCDGFIKVEG